MSARAFMFGLLAASVAACSPSTPPPDNLEFLLEAIRADIDTIDHTGSTGSHRYSFSHDRDFPCSVSLTENNVFRDEHWTRTYRFELADLSPGQLLAAVDGRRAISYYSTRKTGETAREFSPKKINAVQLHAPATSELQIKFDDAIRICVERNAF